MHCPELGSCSVKHRNAYPKAPIFLPKTPHSCARVRRFFDPSPVLFRLRARNGCLFGKNRRNRGKTALSSPDFGVSFQCRKSSHRPFFKPLRGLARRQATAQDEPGRTSRGSPCCGKFSPAVSCPRANLIRRAPIRSQKIRAKRCRTGKVGAQKPFRVQKWPFHRRATRANSFRTAPAFRSSPVCTPHKG